jgi:tripeptide aminopeptidase
MLAAARRLVREPAPVGVELLFTLCEENALAGAKHFDTGRLRSDFGYVYDHASPIGEIVLASPSYHRIVAEFRGRAAHAGVRPEAGRSAIAAAASAIAAMELGRLDELTTANVGTIRGGSGTNVIPALCTIEAEARSLDDERVEQVVSTMIDRLTDAANAGEVDVDVSVERLFQGYRTRPGAPQVRAAEQALRQCGYEPRHIVTGGGSDANALAVSGFPCTNLADGTERNHEPTERIATASLEAMLDITYALVETAAAVDGEPC